MKKLLIIISPPCIVLSIMMWISWGLKGAIAFIGAAIFIVALLALFRKWIEFVDKHIKD